MVYRISICCGTRPELIKMAPLVHSFRKRKAVELELVLIGQHRELTRELLCSFHLKVDVFLTASCYDSSQKGIKRGSWKNSLYSHGSRLRKKRS